MPATPLPPIEIKSARWVLAAWIPIPFILPVVILVIPLATGEGLDAGEVGGQAAYAGLMVAVVLVVVFSMLDHQRTMRKRRLAEAPSGTVFASDAAALEVVSVDNPKRLRRYSGWSTGVLEFGDAGFRFRHAKPKQTFDEVSLAWSEIESVMCERENPFRAHLHVRTTTRQDHAWQVAGAPKLEAALRKLRGDA